MYLAFDIETGGLDDEVLRERCPAFEPPPPPGAFDPTAVKCGNIGGPTSEKGKAKIEEARKAHEELVKRYAADLAGAEERHFADFKSRAALDATTGRVVAIGFCRADAMETPAIIDCDQDEEAGLREWWRNVEDALSDRLPLIGFNVCHFDLPFLVRRSWLLGVPMPTGPAQGPLLVRLDRRSDAGLGLPRARPDRTRPAGHGVRPGRQSQGGRRRRDQRGRLRRVVAD